MEPDAAAAAAQVLADPLDPSSPYLFGVTRLLTLRIAHGPTFRPGETKTMHLGVSVLTHEPAAVCVMQGWTRFGSRAFRVPFTVLRDADELVDVSVSITNLSSSPHSPRDEGQHLKLLVFALPLPRVSVDRLHLFSQGRETVRLRGDSVPSRVTVERAGAGHEISLVCRRLRWAPLRRSPFGTHGASLWIKLPETGRAPFPANRYDSIVQRAVSDPHVRVDHVEDIAGRRALRVFLVFDPRERVGERDGDGRSSSAGSGRRGPTVIAGSPPDELTLRLLALVRDAEVLLRREPGPIMTPLEPNGFRVTCPRPVRLAAGQSAELFVQNAFTSESEDVALFLPTTGPELNADVTVWRPRKALRLVVRARADLQIALGAPLGVLYFFPEDERLFERAPSLPLPQSEVRGVSCHPNALRWVRTHYRAALRGLDGEGAAEDAAGEPSSGSDSGSSSSDDDEERGGDGDGDGRPPEEDFEMLDEGAPSEDEDHDDDGGGEDARSGDEGPQGDPEGDEDDLGLWDFEHLALSTPRRRPEGPSSSSSRRETPPALPASRRRRPSAAGDHPGFFETPPVDPRRDPADPRRRTTVIGEVSADEERRASELLIVTRGFTLRVRVLVDLTFTVAASALGERVLFRQPGVAVYHLNLDGGLRPRFTAHDLPPQLPSRAPTGSGTTGSSRPPSSSSRR